MRRRDGERPRHRQARVCCVWRCMGPSGVVVVRWCCRVVGLQVLDGVELHPVQQGHVGVVGGEQYRSAWSGLRSGSRRPTRAASWVVSASRTACTRSVRLAMTTRPGGDGQGKQE